jgi:hypothetical protein
MEGVRIYVIKVHQQKRISDNKRKQHNCNSLVVGQEKKIEASRWKPPPAGWIEINVDGAIELMRFHERQGSALSCETQPIS